ncbi:MAG: hypothetical protein ACRD7E_08980 [Bryobacteraceae bacterium]
MRLTAALLMMVIAVIAASGGTLYEQSLARLLENRFQRDGIAWLLLDIETGRVIASRWTGAEMRLPVGSLAKPFMAVNYNGPYPRHTCRPGQCWLPRGHGTIGIVHAIAQSCNSYFRRIAPGSEWTASPIEVARAYSNLISNRRAGPVLQGMRESARQGTGKAIAADALVKTGTASCTHRKGVPGDGYAAVLYPADSPRYVLVVQRHGAPGSKAAESAGEILRVMQAGR